MLAEKEIVKKLSAMISKERLQHSLRVRDIAVNLATKYNVNIYKTNIAGILHDCAKGYAYEESLNLCKRLGLELDEITKSQKALIHAPLSAKIAEFEFGIRDNEILNAIRYHTTGRENMSLLEKIIWIADYTEPERKFKGVEEVRELLNEDINKALLKAFEQTICKIVQKNYVLHPMTVVAYNSILKEINITNITID